LFILAALLALPPFFDGGNGALIGPTMLVFIALAFSLFSGPNGAETGKNKKKTRFFPSPLFFLFLFLAFGLISVFFSTSPYNSFEIWIQYLGYGVLFFVAANLRTGEKETDFLVKIFLGASAALSLVGIYFYLTGNYARLTSTFYWPNPFAGYLLFSLPLAICLFLEKREKESGEKLFSGLVLALIIAAFVLTGSRGAFLSVLSVLPIFIYYYSGKLRQFSAASAKKSIAGILLILLLSAALITGINFLKQDGFGFASHARNSFTESDFSAAARLNYWRGAWDIFKDYPVFGSGPGTFQTIYRQYQKNPASGGKYAHNLYLEMLSEAGIFVLLFFILFLSYVYRSAREGLKEKKYALPLFVGTLAFLIHNGVDIDWHFGANALVFWMFLGLLYGAAKHKSGEYKQKGFKAAAVFISALLLIGGIMFLYGGYHFNQGLLLQSRGELASAENAFGKSVLLNPNSRHLRRYGIILYARGAALSGEEREALLSKALEISEKTIESDRLNALNYELRGKILIAQNKLIEAEDDFREAIRLDKFNPRHYINLAELLISLNRTEDARETINNILLYYSEKTVKNRQGRIMKGQKEFSGIKKEINYLKYLLSAL